MIMYAYEASQLFEGNPLAEAWGPQLAVDTLSTCMVVGNNSAQLGTNISAQFFNDLQDAPTTGLWSHSTSGAAELDFLDELLSDDDRTPSTLSPVPSILSPTPSPLSPTLSPLSNLSARSPGNDNLSAQWSPPSTSSVDELSTWSPLSADAWSPDHDAWSPDHDDLFSDVQPFDIRATSDVTVFTDDINSFLTSCGAQTLPSAPVVTSQSSSHVMTSQNTTTSDDLLRLLVTDTSDEPSSELRTIPDDQQPSADQHVTGTQAVKRNADQHVTGTQAVKRNADQHVTGTQAVKWNADQHVTGTQAVKRNADHHVTSTQAVKRKAGRKSKVTSAEERKCRKRAQNKDAATRYRDRKREEQRKREAEFEGLRVRNRGLKDKEVQITREIDYLRELMVELYRMKGLISR